MTGREAAVWSWSGCSCPPPSSAGCGGIRAALRATPPARRWPATRRWSSSPATWWSFPGPIGSPHHFQIWMHGDTPLTSRLFHPLLVDARSGALAAVLDMPWYLRALEVSRPLHFGDYGGLPLKVLWAVLMLPTLAGLLTAVLDDASWRWLSTGALGVPVAVGLWCALRPRAGR